jgi:enterochelin esterase-like enzyme
MWNPMNYKTKTRKIKLTSFGKVIVGFIIASNPTSLFSQDSIPPPTSGFDRYNKNIPHCKTEVVSYYSSTVGVTRKTRILLPPGYNKDSVYNVLYLLHGIGGDINEWYSNGTPHYIIENLYAQGKIAPMIVVLPNGRAMVDDSPGSNIYAADKVAGFANFEFELIKDLIPFIDTTYPVKRDREARAIAGLSMGGGQALNFGLAHLDTFAWVGAFSPAPNTKAAASLIPNLQEDTAKISGLWISCGGADGLIYISQNTHNFLVQNKIKHYYLVEPGKGHDWTVWKPGLYHFTQRIFGRVPQKDTTISGILQTQFISKLNISYSPSYQTITLSGMNNIKNISLYDLNGRQTLFYSNVSNNVINIGKLSRGIYVVVAFDGRRSLFGKVVKF